MKITFEILEKPNDTSYLWAECREYPIFLYEKDIENLAKAARTALELYFEAEKYLHKKEQENTKKWQCDFSVPRTLQLSY